MAMLEASTKSPPPAPSLAPLRAQSWSRPPSWLPSSPQHPAQQCQRNFGTPPRNPSSSCWRSCSPPTKMNTHHKTRHTKLPGPNPVPQSLPNSILCPLLECNYSPSTIATAEYMTSTSSLLGFRTSSCGCQYLAEGTIAQGAPCQLAGNRHGHRSPHKLMRELHAPICVGSSTLPGSRRTRPSAGHKCETRRSPCDALLSLP